MTQRLKSRIFDLLEEAYTNRKKICLPHLKENSSEEQQESIEQQFTYPIRQEESTSPSKSFLKMIKLGLKEFLEKNYQLTIDSLECEEDFTFLLETSTLLFQIICKDETHIYELVIFDLNSLMMQTYMKDFQILVEYLNNTKTQMHMKPYVEKFDETFFTSYSDPENENLKYMVALKQVNNIDISSEELCRTLGETLGHLSQLGNTIYLPGLNYQFQVDLEMREKLGQENYEQSFMDEDLTLSDIEDQQQRFEEYERRQEKILIKQLCDYYNLEFEQFIRPKLYSLKRGLSINRLNKFLMPYFEKISYGFNLENLITAISSIYISNQVEFSLKQSLINELVKGYNSQVTLDINDISCIFHMVTSRIVAEIELKTENYKQSVEVIKKLIKVNPIYFENQIRNVCNLPLLYEFGKEPNYDPILQDRQNMLLKNMPIFFTKTHPVNIVQGAFQYLYDDHGRTFVDCANNVQHVGHGHPRVARAGSNQITKFNSNTRFLNKNIVEYAKYLLKTAFDPQLNTCMFCNSGSEANDMALNISRVLMGSKDVIIMNHSYHGTTTAVQEISTIKFNSKGGTGKEDYIHIVDMPDQYRGKYKYDDPECGMKYAMQVKQVIDDLKQKGRKVAAFICESMPAVGGMTTLPTNYLKYVYQFVREQGGLCISDEVQCGFGRVQDKWWAYELQDVVPDIVVIGKPMGNGHPVAGLVMRQEISTRFNNGQPYFNTYGGNPVSMKIAEETLKVIVEERLRENSAIVGQFLIQELRKLQDKHEIIGDVRGTGLFIGIELVRNRETKEGASQEAEMISNLLKNRGFIILHEGFLKNVLKIKPSLAFSLENSRDFIQCFDNILTQKSYLA